ncbi:GNAT family N-acetyltransferase [uncultured Methanobrevibacter sp.]|uniref:GNAT family N-acetyltransferase n=1 Tax=uncultured Methanobrevibacter sp. TaxID=253161 RepID=UPI0025DAA3B4|nr:GNAT family N-acetyltransferase [uncultured Methanobrevibacter sp.]
MEWVLKQFNQLSLDELYGIVQLRLEVFVVEQNCPYQDLDGKDQSAYHLFLKDNDVIVAALRVLPENVAYDETAIGRLIVKEVYRGQKIAKAMMEKAIEFITDDLGKDKIRLSGQAYLTDFYIGLGFKKVSEEYLEDGIKHYEFLYEA